MHQHLADYSLMLIVDTMTTDNRPWYKEPYVLMLIGVPLSSVIMGIFFISLAVNTKDTLVRDNYYKDGLAINQEMKWDKKSVELDIELSVLIEGNNASIAINKSRQTPPTTLTLKLSHPTLKEKDRDAFLQHSQKGNYKGFINNLEDGRYYIMVESIEQQWRIRKSVHITQGSAFLL